MKFRETMVPNFPTIQIQQTDRITIIGIFNGQGYTASTLVLMTQCKAGGQAAR